MISPYQERQRKLQIAYHDQHPGLFDHTPRGGHFQSKPRDFVLQHGPSNLHPAIRAEAQAYFARHTIAWWGGTGPSGHLLSSQVACVNHLFAVRSDRDAVTRLLQALDGDVAEALAIPSDTGAPGFVQFEATGDESHLNEGRLQRGTQCTSLDALAYARLRDGRRRLFGIEWKYTEYYGPEDKFRDTKLEAGHSKGEVRKRRYASVLDQSAQLTSRQWTDYGCEPFYQLLRQTLLLEQLVAHRTTERLAAESWRHIHVIPRQNEALLAKAYPPSGLPMEAHWRSLLRDQTQYVVVDPRDFLEPLGSQYDDLRTYLGERYWN